MMANIFLNFLHQFDARMGLSDTEVLLFVDKCPASPPDSIFDKDHISPSMLHEQTADTLICVWYTG
jgi:hypothetical protein